MKTVTPKPAVKPDTMGKPVASAPEAVSSNTPDEAGGNPMSDMGDMRPENGLGYNDVHCESSKPGKFEFGFMESDTTETPMATPKQPSGVYPVSEMKEGPNAKPTHAPGTYAPAE